MVSRCVRAWSSVALAQRDLNAWKSDPFNRMDLMNYFSTDDVAAYGIWQLPTSPERFSPCSRNYYVLSQGNNTNKAIDGRVIMYHNVVSTTQCGDFCLRQPRCRSINLAHVSDTEKTRACELLEDEQNIVYRPGFSYWLFDRGLYTKVTYSLFNPLIYNITLQILLSYCHALLTAETGRIS